MSIFLLRLARMVSPLEKWQTGSIESALHQVSLDPFEVTPVPNNEVLLESRVRCFEAGKVLFTSIKQTHRKDKNRVHTTWMISRAPFNSSSPLPHLVYPPEQLKTNGGPTTTNNDVPTAYNLMHKVKLWDGRFWIQLYYSKPAIVPFRKELKPRLTANLTPAQQKSLKRLMQKNAPGKVQWTLPAIAVWDNPMNRPNPYDARKSDFDLKDAQIIALPTLGIIQSDWENAFYWDIRYKKIDLPGLVPSPGCMIGALEHHSDVVPLPDLHVGNIKGDDVK